MKQPGVLYISYDGMLEPLGQSQVVAYLEQLADAFAIVLMSYEKSADLADRARVAAMRERLARAGIRWRPLRYHKRPTVPATLFDIAQGMMIGSWLALRHRVRIVHARSFVAALIGRAVRRIVGARLLYDMRGLWAQERVDGGLWAADGRLYRTASRLERGSVLAADYVVTLTEASRPVIAAMTEGASRRAPIAVIPTCADLARFSPGNEGVVEPFTLGYVGSIGTWYMFEDVLRVFLVLRARRPEARLLVVNRAEGERVRALIAAAGLADEAVQVVSVEHAGVPAMIRRMSAGVALVRPLPSKLASAPTKLAEYLGCGIPCLGNSGVGDVAAILEEDRVGAALDRFDDAALAAAVDRLLALCADPGIAQRCRAAAIGRFALADGVARYAAAYRELTT